MATIVVRGRDDLIPGSIHSDGSVPLVGDIINIGMAHNHRGRWRVVEREHRVTGPRCVLAFIIVEPADADAFDYIASGGKEPRPKAT